MELLFILAFIALAFIVLVFSHFQKTYKIAYYEAKLENRGVDISEVKNMPFYKLWIN
ncbi:MAG: hypothetical protein GY870_09480 [archaeon]|nr:hypothetical protein [archaeon]